ncbi:hypothetical protein [Streptococcus sp. SS-4456]|uniref:hypothetical protein n=1 Tax=Streptococcus sp. SS-4456 TaxID=3072286 RepID=UPI002FCB49C8
MWELTAEQLQNGQGKNIKVLYFWEQGEQLQEATQILLDLSDQPTQSAIELNSDMVYIKNRLAELQSMTTMADIKVGLAKTYRIAELMED